MSEINPNAYFGLSGAAAEQLEGAHDQLYQSGAEAIAWDKAHGINPQGVNAGSYYGLSGAAAQQAIRSGQALYQSGQEAINWNNAHGIPTIDTPQSGSISGDTGIQGPTSGLTSTQQDAWAQLQQTLQQYGFTGNDLTALIAFAKNQIIAGNSQSQILLNLEQTPQFATRFPAIPKLAAEGVAISPADYISLEQQYASLEHAAGLPADFTSYDNLIAGQVSPSEYSDRLTKGYLAVENAPPETVQAMQDYYGVTRGQLAAYFLDPTKQEPILMQQAMAAQIGGASATSGFGEVGQSQAMRLAQMGVSYAQAQQGFQTLSGQSQLFANLPGQGQRYGFTTDNLLGAQFGSDGQTKLQLEIQAQQEKNAFAAGTQSATTSTGMVGTGAVQR